MPKLKDMIPGGKGDNVKVNDFDSKELAMGIKTEMEHTNSKEKAKEIALDHLTEDPKYYTKLKAAGLADELSESKVGDVYISIGEAIEEIASGYKKLDKLIKFMKLKPESPENQNLYKLKHVLIDLKTTFGDSYDFEDKKAPVQLTKLNVYRLIDYLDSLATFKQYRDVNASYDDQHYINIPYDLLVRYGLTKRVLDKINNNTEEYSGYISTDEKKKTVSISGGDN